MSKEGGFGSPALSAGAPWAVGLVAVAALLTRTPAPAPPSTPPLAEPRAAAAVAVPPGRALAAVVPIVKLIADVANVRVTPPEIVQSWDVLLPQLEKRGAAQSAAAIERIGRLVHESVEGPEDAGTDSPAIPDEQVMAILTGLELPNRGDFETHRRRVLDHFRDTRAPADYVSRIRDRVAQVADVTFVIATVPDYADSYSRWIADEAFASIQAAAGTAGYSLDRFLTPGWPQPRESEGRTRRAQEFEPGALIFRGSPSGPQDDTRTAASRAAPEGDGRGPFARRLQLLVVLVVAETATRGLEKPAFAAASQLVLAWTPSGPVHLNVLGPHFSGTSQSLRLAIESIFGAAGPRARTGDLQVRVVTGSATSRSNSAIIEGFVEDPPGTRRRASFGTDTAGQVEFESAVHTDPEMLGPLERRLDAMGIPPSQVALLVEENTAWGSALFTRPRTDAAVHGESTEPVPPGTCENADKGTFSCAIRLSFPMHVSRLAAVTSKAATAAPFAAATLPQLDLVDSKEPSDRLPTFTPALTEGTLTTALAGILATLGREQVRAVGILATDKRDFVFLAREVIRAAPNVQLFTIEPHILFLHPEYRSFVRGTLVASSYPLYSRTQPVLFPLGPSNGTGLRQRRQFVNMAAQGRYNALLYLLDRPDLLVDATADVMAEGDEKTTVRPAAVWLGIVGQNRFVPLDASSRVRHPLLWERYLSISGMWSAARVLLMLALASQLVLIVMARYGHTPVLRGLFAPFTPASDPDVAREQGLLTAAVIASLAMLLVWFLMLARAITADRGLSSAVVALPMLVFAVIAGAIAAAQLVVRGVGRAVDGWRAARGGSSAARQRAATVAVTLVAVSALGALTYGFATWFVIAGPEFSSAWRAFRDLARPELASLQFAAERTLDVSSFVSPTAPIVAFAIVGYAWAMWSLRCLRHQTYRIEATAPLMLTLTRNDQRLAADFSGALASTVHPTGRYFVLPLAALLLLAPGLVYTYSVDGRAFARALVFGSGLALLAATVEAAQAAWLGWRLKATLERLRLHPIADEITARGKDPLDWGISVEPKFGTARRVLRDRLVEVRLHLERVQQAVLRPHVHTGVYQGVDRRKEASTSVPPPVSAPLPSGLAAFGQRAALRSNDLEWIEHWDHGVPNPDARETPPDDPARLAEDTRPLFETTIWRVAVTASNQLAPVLWRRYWSKGRTPGSLTLADSYFHSAERFVSLMAALVLRAVVARVVRGLSLALLLCGILFVGHLLYTFPGRQLWLMADLVTLTVVSGIGAVLLIALERDEVLSGLWSTRPGRVGVESGLVMRIAAYVALPLLTLFATQFPEAAGGLTTWLDPVRQVLPR
jgi:hypothetical protein